MKRIVSIMIIALLLFGIFATVTAHELPYIQVVVPGNPGYVITSGFGVKTIEKQIPIDGGTGIFSEYWEFLEFFMEDPVVKYMTFIRWHKPPRGESFEIVTPKTDVEFNTRAVEQLQFIEQALRWYLPSGAP